MLCAHVLAFLVVGRHAGGRRGGGRTEREHEDDEERPAEDALEEGEVK